MNLVFLLWGGVALPGLSELGNNLAHSSANESHSDVLGWIITPGRGWQKAVFLHDEYDRKHYLGEFYEEIKVSENGDLGKPFQMRNLLGLKWSNYYLVSGDKDSEWKVVDSHGKGYMIFQVFYSPDQTTSRQLAMDRFTDILRIPHEHNSFYMNQVNEQGIRMLVEKKSQYPFCAERFGYSLYLQPYTGSISDTEVRELAEIILDALAGKRKFGFFPDRARRLEAMSKMSPDELSRRKHLLKKEAKSKMAPGVWDGISGKSSSLIEMLKVKPLLEQANDKEKRDLFPNINSGIGTLAWIRKHMDVPFEPDNRNDETHVNGISGTFMFQKGERKYPIRYMISHLGSHVRALCALFSMQCDGRMDVQKIAEITRLHPGLVGDYDLCLVPILNELGVSIPDSEQAWICFVRGNTAVMLKSEDLQVSVLPLARIIDEALKKNIELYETPEVER